MTKRYPRKTVTEVVETGINLAASLKDARAELDRLIEKFGDDSVLMYEGYDSCYYELSRTRLENDTEYQKRLTKLRKQETDRKAALERKKERLQLAQAEAEQEERALYEVLRKKFGERQADG